MPAQQSFDHLSSLLADADVLLDGGRPWDIRINDREEFLHMFNRGTLGIGEGYMLGVWDCDALDEMIYRVLHYEIERKIRSIAGFQFGVLLGISRLKQFVGNPQSIFKAKRDVSYHYDTGNLLFQTMLDKRMAYSCAYWKDAANLDEAQEQKLDLLCRKLGLHEGMRVLDIGCGWGSFMLYAAEKYGVQCDGITLSEQQALLGREFVSQSGLPVTFYLQDYRDLNPSEKYDAVVSVGMIEHVGVENYSDYFKTVYRLLKADGVFVLHTIGQVENSSGLDPWINKYIFPNGHIPSVQQLSNGMEGCFLIDDVQNLGEDYDRTLLAWAENFEKGWDKLQQYYDEKFHRMWRYYLLSCAGAFRARDLQVWQFGLTPAGMPKKEFLRAA